jgi:ComF family protein
MAGGMPNCQPEWIPMVYNWLGRLRSALYPPTCRLCGDAGGQGLDLCPGCMADLPGIGSACRRCARPLPEGVAEGLCGACQRRPPALDRCHALLRYEFPVDYLIHRLKFQRDLAMAELLGGLLARSLGAVDRPERLVPVPLHRRRLRERGYNQALEMARPLARALGLSLDPGLVRRVRPTECQSLLPVAERRRNVRRAFAVASSDLPAHVAILDDVYTTGSTANELAATLKRAGVKRVDLWVVARAGLGH